MLAIALHIPGKMEHGDKKFWWGFILLCILALAVALVGATFIDDNVSNKLLRTLLSVGLAFILAYLVVRIGSTLEEKYILKRGSDDGC